MDINFSTKIDKSKVSVRFYEMVDLKPSKNTKKSFHPIYIDITFKSKRTRVKSKLWDTVLKVDGKILVSATFKDKEQKVIVDGSLDIPKDIVKNKKQYKELCEYEFNCLIDLINHTKPEDVYGISKAYEYYGSDALRIVSFNIIQLIASLPEVKKANKGSFILSEYFGLTNNFKHILHFLLDSGYDPISIMSMLDETSIIEGAKNYIDTKLYNDFWIISRLIGSLSFSLPQNFSDVLPAGMEKDPIIEKFGLIHFPIIHLLKDDIFMTSPGLNKAIPTLREYVNFK